MSSLAQNARNARGFYPERSTAVESRFDQVAASYIGYATNLFWTHPWRFRAIVERVNAQAGGLSQMSESGIAEEVLKAGTALRSEGLTLETVARTFALTRELGERKVGMRHFDVQLIGGWVLLNGMVAEMETGEGKTLTATLAAITAALAGIPVHVITVNDYLAGRDAALMKPLYEAFGLSVGVISHEMDLGQRRQAYRCDITYCTNKELVFDYLRDRLVLGKRSGHIQRSLERLYSSNATADRLRLHGLFFAIVDEADSVLIDEARTPLIISGKGDNSFEAEVYSNALRIAKKLEMGRDYEVDFHRRGLELTEPGKERLATLAKSLGSIWKGRVLREQLCSQALSAMHLFIKDRDYLVREGKVQIIDEYTGRLMADRSWEQGLHQMIETKEFCELTTQNETLTKISYQRFFRRYFHLSGMTGTAREVANEMWAVYRLRVAAIPPNKPVIRRRLPPVVFRTSDEKWKAVLDRIVRLHREGRPVLIGSRSVAASEHLSSLLSEAGLPHRVLNARQDSEEAEIVAQAGERGQITVATNMAGRGTDIRLGPGVVEIGGLHVIGTERHEARRIDRQLFGRCGRQGDPGSHESFASLEDDLLLVQKDSIPGSAARHSGRLDKGMGGFIGRFFATHAQRMAERNHFQMRRDLLKVDESMEDTMGFSGLIE